MVSGVIFSREPMRGNLRVKLSGYQSGEGVCQDLATEKRLSSRRWVRERGLKKLQCHGNTHVQSALNIFLAMQSILGTTTNNKPSGLRRNTKPRRIAFGSSRWS